MDNVRQPAAGPWHYVPYVPAPGPGARAAAAAVGGFAAGMVAQLAPDSYVDPARAPGPVLADPPAIPALTPAPTRAGILGLPPPEDPRHEWWLVPAIVVGALVAMAGMIKLAATRIRRYQPRPAGPD